MVLKNVGEFKNINDYVKDKTQRYQREIKSCATLFEYMFSEKENILAERSDGYRIQKTTYGECYDKIFKIAKIISDKLFDLPNNALVGIYMSNSVEWIQIFWSVLMCGYRPVLMNSRLSDETLEGIIRGYEIGAVITDGKAFSVTSLNCFELINQATDESIVAPKWANEIAFMSSGTSDNVKLCFYNGENLFYQVCESAHIIETCPQMKEHYNGELKQLALLPFYHIFGFIAVYIWFGFYSRTFVFLKDLSPQTLLNTVKKHKVTHIFAVPLVWDTIYKTAIRTIKGRGEKTYNKFQKALALANSTGALGNIISKKAMREVRSKIFGDSIKFMISGGSNISTDVLTFFNGIGYHLANGYGMTEIGITSVELSSSKKHLNSATIGTPFKQTKYRISENGELLVKSRTRAVRIIQNNSTIETDYEKYFNTHDLVTHRNGRYYIEGRKDDLIVCENGENINPTIAERSIKIKGCDSLCIFLDENAVPTLILSVPNCFTQEQLDTVFTSAKAELEKAKLENEVKQIVMTTEPLLLSDEFKISRRKVAKRYSAGEYQILTQDNFDFFAEKLSKLEAEVRLIFSEILKLSTDKIGVDQNFFMELGGTSLDYFALIEEIKARFEIHIPIEDGITLSTVRELCEYIKNQSRG